MSRQNNCRHKTESWPYLCPWHLNDAIRARIDILSDTGCWKWVGWQRAGRPHVFLKGSKKVRHISGQANHLTWWMKHGERIQRPYFLKQTCDTHHCVNPDHREKSSFRHVRTWTMREVKQMRESYWGTDIAEGKRRKNTWLTSAARMTAEHFNVHIQAIRRFVAGNKPQFSRWPDTSTTLDMLRAEYDKNVRLAKANSRRREDAMTIAKIAKQSRTGDMAVCDMLRGHTYKSADGPTAPVKQAAHKLRVA